jgi:nucleoside-triphosphatase THEP1
VLVIVRPPTPVVLVTGPPAIGKTALSCALSERLDCRDERIPSPCIPRMSCGQGRSRQRVASVAGGRQYVLAHTTRWVLG